MRALTSTATVGGGHPVESLARETSRAPRRRQLRRSEPVSRYRPPRAREMDCFNPWRPGSNDRRLLSRSSMPSKSRICTPRRVEVAALCCLNDLRCIFVTLTADWKRKPHGYLNLSTRDRRPRPRAGDRRWTRGLAARPFVEHETQGGGAKRPGETPHWCWHRPTAGALQPGWRSAR